MARRLWEQKRLEAAGLSIPGGTVRLRNLRERKTPHNTKKKEAGGPEWEKIIANEATDKGLISKIYKQLSSLISEK